jgi:hypothetical protein
MKWMEECQTAKEWFKQGNDLGASHLIIFYDEMENEHRPLFIFPEQDVEFEVLSIIRRYKNKSTRMVGVVSLIESIENVEAVFRPMNVAISRIEN